MRLSFKPLVLAALLASAGLSSAFAQPAPNPAGTPAGVAAPAPHTGPRGEAHGPRGRFDPAQREAHFQRHFAKVKAQLAITPQQEGSWNAFLTAMKPPAFDKGGPGGPRPSREAFNKLSTPERIDRMREMHARRGAEMQARGDAVKTFYATLSPAQQKTFDQLPHHRPHHGLRGFGGHRGERHGPGHDGMGNAGRTDAPAGK